MFENLENCNFNFVLLFSKWSRYRADSSRYASKSCQIEYLEHFKSYPQLPPFSNCPRVF